MGLMISTREVPRDSLDDEAAVERHYQAAYRGILRLRDEGGDTDFVWLLETMKPGETEVAIKQVLSKKGMIAI